MLLEADGTITDNEGAQFSETIQEIFDNLSDIGYGGGVSEHHFRAATLAVPGCNRQSAPEPYAIVPSGGFTRTPTPGAPSCNRKSASEPNAGIVSGVATGRSSIVNLQDRPAWVRKLDAASVNHTPKCS